ncbi:MAG: ferritin family protein [Burkholderiales bacterium]
MGRPTRTTARGACRRTRSGDEGDARPSGLDALMLEALVMEVEAAQRYLELACAMQSRNNIPIAVLFRKMAATEGHHAEQIMHEMGWAGGPAAPGKRFWETFAVPFPRADLADLTQPWQALTMALAAEERAQRFFDNLAQNTSVDAVRNAARELQREEEEHCDLIRTWLARVAPPPAGFTSPAARPSA